MSVQTASKYHLTEDQQHLFNRAMWIMVGVVIGGFLFSDKEGYLTNVFTEFAGVLATVFVIDFWVRQRDARQGIEREKESLLRQVRSPENSVAKHAVHELRERGWLTGDSSLLQVANLIGSNLRGANLSDANLQGANLWLAKLQDVYMLGTNLREASLSFANLQEADLRLANLQRASLEHADLRKANLEEAKLYEALLITASLEMANLRKANLQRANLWHANLQGASLERADLQGANLTYADLRRANLRNTNLQGADLKSTRFDETTILPDPKFISPHDIGVPPDSYYQPGVTDMRKYTDPEHPEFWQPDWVKERGG